MVDYSKWDRMEFSSDEDEDTTPRVTSLDEPARVTFGSGGVQFGRTDSSKPLMDNPSPKRSKHEFRNPPAVVPTVSSSRSGDAIDISQLEDVSVGAGKHQGDSTTASTQQERLNRWSKELTNNGGYSSCDVSVVDGRSLKVPLYWSQDRYAVTLRLGFPPSEFSTRSIRVRVVGALNYCDRNSAVGNGGSGGREPSFGSIEIVSVARDRDQSNEETVLLRGRLPRPIHLNEEEDEIHYEIEENLCIAPSGDDQVCTKLVAVTLPKAVPMSGMVLWWDCPLVGLPKIDLSFVGEKRETYKQAWDKAHEIFKEKLKSRERQCVDS
mmetsp:Transcript_10966/g.25516  ORF Transcript_10966/g.25516 Transcript_10966/m.25516 type:complete len:323 (-) Transcript_10966:69-1037(-)